MTIANLIQREASRASNRRVAPAVGIIDSYDPATHSVKIKHDTEVDNEGQPRITGWIPIRCQVGGAGASWVIGPSPGDQATIEYLEDDAEAGVCTGFLHNDVDQPPNAASGVAVLRHTKTGNVFILNPDGSFQWTHKATGNYHKLRADGSVATYISSTSQQHYVGGDPAVAGSFSPISTVAGPSPYAQARYA